MTRIVDLNNGYARLENYGSPYASLIFLLTLARVRRFYAEGYLSKYEFHQALLDMGYSEKEAAWFVALGGVTVEQWKERAHGLGTI